MKKTIIILGSTGSVGSSVLKSIKNKNFKIKLLSANKNIKKLYNQAVYHKVKNVIIEDETLFLKNKNKFKKKNIKLFFGLNFIDKIIKKKCDYCVSCITGIDGLEPTLKSIPLTRNILISNKESLICGWKLISKKLKLFNTNFIPIDSEHYSLWELMKNDPKQMIEKIILTASGGPFLNISKNKISNIKPKYALKHPIWKMGKKISIDSSTMMNKVFEYIEAKNIFELNKKKISIIIHPSSFIHAIVFFKGKIIKFLAHEADMTIPISNALGIKKNINNNEFRKYIKNFNNLRFDLPKQSNFPLLSLINKLPNKLSFFETILITLNDNLVDKYLNNKINYSSLHRNLLNFIKKPYFNKYYKIEPKNIYDIKKVVKLTNDYLNSNIKYYD